MSLMDGRRLQRYGAVQCVSTRTPHLDAELDRVEAHTVAEAARRVHEDGYRFVGWPDVTRVWIGYRAQIAADGSRIVELEPGDHRAFHVEIRVDVVAEER